MPEAAAAESATSRIALGIAYRGGAYHGWQSQADGRAVQDIVERALTTFVGAPVWTVCAGRTDAGVHALNQVVHLDTAVERAAASWVRGTNRYLPNDVAVQWCRPVDAAFHARHSAIGRRYAYLLRESPVRPALEAGVVGWVFRPLDAAALREAAALLIGKHDFSAFRAAECQAASPVKQLRSIRIERHGAYWRFDFEANAFLHHMVRNIMGSLIAVGTGKRRPDWLADVLASQDRARAAPTFSPDGLYFIGPVFDADQHIPEPDALLSWLPH